jgi:glucan phosphoethanolaminetransferase (alkaline phosphatase superfamily)
VLAIGFGLVHGMGYANYIRMMLSSNQSLVSSLFSFNVGLELGQILVVLFVLSVQWLLSKYKLISPRMLAVLVSVYISVISLMLAVERFQSLHL